MANIAENIKRIKNQLPDGVKLIAVSKFHPVEKLLEAYGAGQRFFGENHAQEIAAKAPDVPHDVKWHFIGHLQSNKVRMIMPHIDMIHSIDSVKLIKTVNKEAARIDRIVKVLLQIHVAQEKTKSGFRVDELLSLADTGQFEGLDHVKVCGIMAMATNTDDKKQVALEFSTVRDTFEKLKKDFFSQDDCFQELSMGMSNDWKIAVDQGSTMVRIGTDIFGPREY